MSGGHAASLRGSARRIGGLAWPVLVGQLAVLAFATVDTAMVARHSTADLAALAVGAAAYIAVFIGLAGVVLAIGPIAGRHFGAGAHRLAGAQLQQTVWLALGLSVLGSTVLMFPAPFLVLARASPELDAKVRGYLFALALSLPAALLFSAFRGFNNAVSRPKAVMALQLGGLALKVPLTALFVFGAGPVPALGVTGCGVATCLVMWCQALVAWQVVRRDPFYRPFGIAGTGARLPRPDRAAIVAQLKLGVPMGLSVMVEVAGFAFMAFFIARIGVDAVAGHQLAANLVSLLFMLPLAIGHAASALVAQTIGAGQPTAARRLGWHGLQLAGGCALALGAVVFFAREPIVRIYTDDEALVAAALPLLAWVGLFHFADAVQIVAAFVLRAWHVAVLPLLVYCASIWGVGLGGGYLLAFDTSGRVPAALLGAPGYWFASTAGLALAASGLSLLLLWVMRQRARETAPG